MNSIVSASATSRPALFRNSGNSSYIATQNDVIKEERLWRFRFSAENRPINERHLARLVKEIKKKNLLPDFPILVTEDMAIIDGQHRFLAAQELELPVYYRVAQAINWGDVAAANASMKKWAYPDFLHYWCSKGKSDYLRVRDFVENTGLPLNITISILAGKSPNRVVGFLAPDGDSPMFLFQNGGYKITHEENAQSFADDLSDMARYHSSTRIAFITAFFKAWSDPRYDHNRMIHQLETYGTAVGIKTSVKVDEYLLQLQYAYNYNRRGENRIIELGKLLDG